MATFYRLLVYIGYAVLGAALLVWVTNARSDLITMFLFGYFYALGGCVLVRFLRGNNGHGGQIAHRGDRGED